MKKPNKTSFILLFIIICLFIFNGNNYTFYLTKLSNCFTYIKNTYFNEPTQEIIPVSKYYYSLLTETDKKHYEVMVNSIRNMDEYCYLDNVGMNDIQLIFDYITYDYPEFFWIENFLVRERKSFGYSSSIVYFVYNCDEYEKAKKQSAIDEQVTIYLEGIDNEASQYQKIKYVYETIIRDTAYNKDATDNQNICSVFINKTSVCGGYTRALQYLLEQLDVSSIYVFGSANGNDHAWNLVNCDGEYLYVDSTWGDPVINGSNACGLDNIDYNYLCCDENFIFQTHRLSDTCVLPY